MAYTVFQAGSTLYGMNSQGAITVLTLPTGVTLDSVKRPRFAVMGNFAIMVNSPSRPITIDANLRVRVLTPNPPSSAITLSGVTTGTLSGTFGARQTYVVFDADGALIGESDFGPDATAVTITTKLLRAQGLTPSADSVNASRLYRTTTGTSTYFQWIDLEGNVQTEIRDDLSDAALDAIAAPDLGTPPDLSLVAEFKGRLFGIARDDVNHIRFSDIERPWAWPADFSEPMPRLGSDNRGCTGFVRRRDALGLGRSNGLYQLTGTSDDDFRIVNVSENCGVESPDSVAVYRDVAFFVWKDGVYQWDVNGITNVCEGKIQRWFTRNGTFNLSRLQYSFATIDPLRKRYKLFLASAGSAFENCWIEYDFVNKTWWGPHTSYALNPTSAFTFSTDGGLTIPMIGASDGKARIERKRATDDDATAIDFDVVTSRQDMQDPVSQKYFGEVMVATKPGPRGTLLVYATSGDTDSVRFSKEAAFNDEPPFETALTAGHHRLGRVGLGQACKFRFRNNEADTDVNLRGYEVSPVHIVGDR
jgi:hypothetical protein